jgi:hypothetical protein
VGFQSHKFLAFVVGIQTPKSHRFVSRCSCNVGSVDCYLFSPGVKPDVDYSISVAFEISAQLAIRDTPNPAISTPATCCEELLRGRQASSRHTPIICVLCLLHSERSDLVYISLQMLFIRQ